MAFPYDNRLDIDWSEVDFIAQSTTILAQRLGCSVQTVYHNWRRLHKGRFSIRTLRIQSAIIQSLRIAQGGLSKSALREELADIGFAISRAVLSDRLQDLRQAGLIEPDPPMSPETIWKIKKKVG